MDFEKLFVWAALKLSGYDENVRPTKEEAEVYKNLNSWYLNEKKKHGAFNEDLLISKKQNKELMDLMPESEKKKYPDLDPDEDIFSFYPYNDHVWVELRCHGTPLYKYSKDFQTKALEIIKYVLHC